MVNGRLSLLSWRLGGAIALAACGGAPLQPHAEGRPECPASARGPVTPVDTRRPNLGGIDWVLLPGGRVTLRDWWGDAEEKQTVTLKAFEIGRTEVTNAQYQRCARAGHCRELPLHPCVDPRTGKETLDECPMVGAGLAEARIFGRWAGARVASEAEWQYAATSGGCDALYPWGNERVSCERAVVASTLSFFDTEAKKHVPVKTRGCGREGVRMKVCSRPRGHSAQGLCDMVGNVAERTNDVAGRVSQTPKDGQPAWRYEGRKITEKGRSRELTWDEVKARPDFFPLLDTLRYSSSLYVVRGGSFLSYTGWDLVAKTRALQSREVSVEPDTWRQFGFRLTRDASPPRR